MWVRVDNRLVHGQVIETWLPYTHASVILVVNDDLAADPIRQEITAMAVPEGVELLFASVADAPRTARRLPDDETLVLFSDCPDARRAYDYGLSFSLMNIGNLHFEPGKRQLCPHIALTTEDVACLDFFSDSGVTLDFRCIPNDPVQYREYR